jgi:hypothetical protein
MGQLAQTSTQIAKIPGDCYNLAQLARLRAGGYLQIGLDDNLVFLRVSHWRCRNRRLGEDLLTWSDFRNGDRRGLQEPVECSLAIHHPYARTIIHQVYDRLRERLLAEQPYRDHGTRADLLNLPVPAGRSCDGPRYR